MKSTVWRNSFWLWLICNAIALPAFSQSPTEENTGRMEMEDKEIKGQRQGKNVVYLFDRQKVQLQSMVKKPTSFRARIIATVFGRT